MGNITLLGIDLAKNVFQLHGVDTKGKAILRKKVKRDKLANFIANLPNCRIVMEACGGANYWARCFQLFGHTVQLMSPQFVKPFVKTNKNDQNDAEAIVEAASRPSMRYVTAKTIEQQDIQNLHRIRTRLVKQRTALGNQIRGILGEYGLVVPKSLRQLRSQVALILEDADNELTILTREVINELMEELNVLDERIESYEKRLDRIIRGSESAKRLMTIPGVGEISSTAVIAAVGNADAFKNGRQLAAWLGLVPRQSSSGGKDRLLGISKRGDSYLRQLLIHGARSVLQKVDNKDDAKSIYWALKKKTLGPNRAAVALANKNARIIWALLTKQENYCSDYHAVAYNGA